MKKFFKGYRSRIFFIVITIGTAIIVTTSILIGVQALYKSSDENYKYSIKRFIEPKESIQNIIKSRTLSLFFAKAEGLYNYTGTYGTGWVIPNGVRVDDDSLLRCYIATNFHVIDKYVYPINDVNLGTFNNLETSYEWRSNFDSIFLKYYDNNNFKHTLGDDLSERRFITKDMCSVKYISIDSNKDTNYLVNQNANIDDQNDDGPYWVSNSQTYIMNRYIDFSIMEFDIPKGHFLYDWMFKIYEIDSNPDKYLSLKIDFLKPNERDLVNQFINPNDAVNLPNVYLGGFPINRGKPSWSAVDFRSNINSSNNPEDNIANYSFTTKNNYIGSAKPHVFDNKQFVSISNQIILPTIDLGFGSSGSMIIAELNDNNKKVYRIVGIWWGLYVQGNNQNNGSGELFFNMSNYPTNWSSYNLLDVINKLIKE